MWLNGEHVVMLDVSTNRDWQQNILRWERHTIVDRKQCEREKVCWEEIEFSLIWLIVPLSGSHS